MPFVPIDEYGRPMNAPSTPTPDASAPAPAVTAPAATAPTGGAPIHTPSWQPIDQYGRVIPPGSSATPFSNPTPPPTPQGQGFLSAAANQVKGGIMGFLSDTSNTLQKTWKDLVPVVTAPTTPGEKYPSLENQYRNALAGTSVVGSGISDVASSLFNHMGITGAISNEMKAMGNALDTVNPDMQIAIKQGLSLTGQAYTNWAQAHPDAADQISKWKNTLQGAALTFSALQTANGVANSVGTTWKNVRLGATNPAEMGLTNPINLGTPGDVAARGEMVNEGLMAPPLTNEIPAGTPGAGAAQQEMINEGAVPGGFTNPIDKGTPGDTAARATLNNQSVPLTEQQLGEAAKVGIPPRDVAVIDGANQSELAKMREMTDLAKQSTDSRLAAGEGARPEAVAGKVVTEQADYLQAARASIGQQLRKEVTSMPQGPLDVSGAQSYFERRLTEDGVRLTQPMDGGEGLDFSQSPYANDAGAQKLINQLSSDFTSTNGQMTPVEIRAIRQRVFHDLSLAQQQSQMTPAVQSIMENTRSALDAPLKAASGTYASLAKQYAQATTALRDLYTEVGKKFADTEGPLLDLRAGEVGNRMMGNASANTLRVMSQLTDTAKALGYQGTDNLNRLFNYADMLKDYYPIVQPTSLPGQVERGINNAVEGGQILGEAAHGGFFGAGAKILKKIFNVTPEARQSVLESLLGTGSPVDLNNVQYLDNVGGTFRDLAAEGQIPGADSIKAVGNGPTTQAPEASNAALQPSGAPAGNILPTDTAQAADQALGQGSDSLGLKGGSRGFTNPADGSNGEVMNPSKVPKIDRSASIPVDNTTDFQNMSLDENGNMVPKGEVSAVNQNEVYIPDFEREATAPAKIFSGLNYGDTFETNDGTYAVISKTKSGVIAVKEGALTDVEDLATDEMIDNGLDPATRSIPNYVKRNLYDLMRKYDASDMPIEIKYGKLLPIPKGGVE